MNLVRALEKDKERRRSCPQVTDCIKAEEATDVAVFSILFCSELEVAKLQHVKSEAVE